MNLEQIHQLFLTHNSVCTDTRKLKKNDLFFALKGDTFNGNTYANKAIELGASYVVVDEPKYATHKNSILVKDVLNTLQDLARFHRNYLGLKIIALTGSNGKTTTKELIQAVLSQKYNTVATTGNFNNHIGVPLTLLSMDTSTEIGIVEMGANHQKEIEFLCTIAQPDFGYITNFGKAHLEGFGGVEGVIKGKSELYDYLIANNKHIFFNADDSIQLEKLSSYIKKFGFSQDNSDNYQIRLVDAEPFVSLEIEGTTINSNLIGAYNFTNLCAACIIGKYFNIEVSAIKPALEGYVPSNNRSQIITKDSNKIILDAYNANPSSMKAALDNLSKLRDQNKIAILGDMFELGESSAVEHQFVADYAIKLNLDRVFLVGKNFNATSSLMDQFASFEDLKEHLSKQELNNATILIKGSRGMALERVLDVI